MKLIKLYYFSPRSQETKDMHGKVGEAWHIVQQCTSLPSPVHAISTDSVKSGTKHY